MKISIITVCYNSADYIEDCIKSVINQTYPNIEYIVVDGNSTDGTKQIIQKFSDKISLYISEPDHGLYDAMNKGIHMATGDYIGILNSDDFFTSNNVVYELANFINQSEANIIFGDVNIISRKNTNKQIRYYSGKYFSKSLLKFGIMPPHASCYIKHSVFKQYGEYNLNYKISADFELLVRFIHKHKVSIAYCPLNFVTMRDGGMSNKGYFKSKGRISDDILMACKKNELSSNRFIINLRYFYKISQYFRFSKNKF
jgi:glycosyltransferase involved in cell wall biosynthesis